MHTLGIGDRWLLAAALGLVAAGGVAMASASSTVNPVLASRHAMWVAIGMSASLLIGKASYQRWLDLGWVVYGASIAALLVVLVAGAVRLGAARWLSVFGFSLQPSEFAKISTIWVLARYLSGEPAPLAPRAVLASLAIAGCPALLVFLQPDFGSATIFAVVWIGMLWAAGVSRRMMTLLAAGSAACLPIGWHLLKDYQRDRLMAFLNPEADPLGAGYTLIQSTIAIGAGQWFGRGWFAGTQNQLSFLPERHSDFIFSVIGEEWGLVGCLTVVALFWLLVARMLRIARWTPEPQGRLMVAGVVCWIAYQAVVNMGMVMGLLPVVGVPLPFISYGGSSMVSLWIALGAVQSVAKGA